MEQTFRDILIAMRQREDAAWMKLLQVATEAKTAAHAGEVEYQSWFVTITPYEMGLRRALKIVGSFTPVWQRNGQPPDWFNVQINLIEDIEAQIEQEIANGMETNQNKT